MEYEQKIEIPEHIGERELVVAREPKDTPPPIVYDDAFGKSLVVFHRLDTNKFGMPVFDISYKDQDQPEVSLLDLAQEGFYFAETMGSFSTMSQFGDPLIFFNYNQMAGSRRKLLSLGHEIGHSRQKVVVNELLQIVRPEFNGNRWKTLLGRYSRLKEYMTDLALLRAISEERDPNSRFSLAQHIINGGTRHGVDIRDIHADLPEFVEAVIASLLKDTPVGFAHPPGVFGLNLFRANLPAVFSIIDPMTERLAWEYAMKLDKSIKGEGAMHCGFQSPRERIEFMKYYLKTYDQKYQVENYTRWLNEISTH